MDPSNQTFSTTIDRIQYLLADSEDSQYSEQILDSLPFKKIEKNNKNKRTMKHLIQSMK